MPHDADKVKGSLWVRTTMLLGELRRRHVWRVIVAYAVAAFAVLEATDILMPVLGLPDWVLRFDVLLILSGFPVAIALAWAFDIAIVRTPERRSQLTESGTHPSPPPPPNGTGPSTRVEDLVAAAFDRDAQVVFLFFSDLSAGTEFYGEWLKLTKVLDDRDVRIFRTSESSYLGLVRHPTPSSAPTAPPSMMLSLVTDRLDAWYRRLEERGADIVIPMAASAGRPMRAFLVRDPAGNMVEFLGRTR